MPSCFLLVDREDVETNASSLLSPRLTHNFVIGPKSLVCLATVSCEAHGQSLASGVEGRPLSTTQPPKLPLVSTGAIVDLDAIVCAVRPLQTVDSICVTENVNIEHEPKTTLRGGHMQQENTFLNI